MGLFFGGLKFQTLPKISLKVTKKLRPGKTKLSAKIIVNIKSNKINNFWGLYVDMKFDPHLVVPTPVTLGF